MCASSPNWVRLTQITTIRDFFTSDFSTFWLGQWCEQVPDICGQTGHPWRVTGFLGQLNRDVQFGPKVGQIGIKWDKYHTFQHQTQNVLKTGFKNSHVFVPLWGQIRQMWNSLTQATFSAKQRRKQNQWDI